LAADVVMLANLGPTETGEIRLGLVRASAIRGIGHRMVDPVHFVMGMEAIPRGGFVGMDNRATDHVIPDHRKRGGLTG
jgi:hypothetical protein